MSQKTFTVTRGEAGATLLEYTASQLDLSRKAAKRLLDARGIFVNRRRVWMAKHVLKEGDRVEVVEGDAAPVKVPQVLVEDDAFLVVNKPAGILANGPDSLESRLRQLRGNPNLAAVHRLDRDTSGCIILANDEPNRQELVSAFRRREVMKTYHALVRGRYPQRLTRLDSPVEGKAALTHVRVLAAGKTASHLQLTIETGRTHQIRLHLAAAHHAVLGDRSYATGVESSPERRRVPRQMLHAVALTFPHPRDRKRVKARAPLPPDFRRCLKELGLG